MAYFLVSAESGQSIFHTQFAQASPRKLQPPKEALLYLYGICVCLPSLYI